jgi:NAD(P)-dependent dehydrogenase (short-subunit alcohol dehydrogenase family)
MKKILVIGANGTIGKAVVDQLKARHQVISVGSRSGDFQANMENLNEVHALFERVGKVDAVIVAAGNVHFGPLAEMNNEQFAVGLNSKLMGQVNVAQVATRFLNDGGSITLTSGILSEQPIRYGAAATMTNRAVEGYVVGAAIELPRGIRINVVSPTVLVESLHAYGPYFLGFEAAPAARVALAYERSVEGAQTGQIYKVE